MRVNFPASHPLQCGYQWNAGVQNQLLAEADVILVAGSDVPWMPAVNRPAPSARIFMLDADPVKEHTPLWHIPACCYARADLALALGQVTARLSELGGVPEDVAVARARRAAAVHQAQRAEWAAREHPGDGDTITPEYLVACVRDAIGPDALVLTEAVSNYQIVSEHLRRDVPGTLIGSGGSSLGSAPERTVVSLVGDGSYLFGVPSAAQWMARRYGAPSLTVIFDNQGWKAPMLATRSVHPAGATAAGGFSAGFSPAPDLPGVAAAAGGAYAATVAAASALPATLRRALGQVRRGRSAVVSARVPPV